MGDRGLAARRRRDDIGGSYADIDDQRVGRGHKGIKAFLDVVGDDPGMTGEGRLLERISRLDNAIEFPVAVLIHPVKAALLG